MSAVLLIWLVLSPAAARADVVLDWNAIATRTVTAGQSPFAQARLMAITQLAVFEAVNAVTGEYESYLDDPIAAPAVTSAEAAAITAAYRVLKTYFPTNTLIDTDQSNALALIEDGLAKTNGISVGEAAAAAMTALRANDGSAACGQFYQWQEVVPNARALALIMITRSSNRSQMMSTTHVCTAGSISALIRRAATRSAAPSRPRSTRTICVPCTAQK